MRKHSLRLWRESGAKITAMVALLLASIVTLAGIPAASAADALQPTAIAFSPEDNFVPDRVLDVNKNSQLTLTKVLSGTEGFTATGSANDANKVAERGVAVSGVTFRLVRVRPTGNLPAGAMDPKRPGTYTEVGPVYTGVTDANGQIKNGMNAGVGIWQTSTGGNNIAVSSFPSANDDKSPAYYLLTEIDSPYSNPSSPRYDSAYTMASPSIFDMPHRAYGYNPGESPNDGFAYHVHVFPKNVDMSQLRKEIVKVTDSSGNARKGKVAQVDDKVVWKVTQKLYDENANGGQKNNDGKLDLAEIRAASSNTPVLVIADRQPMQEITDVKFKLTWLKDSNPESADFGNGTGACAPPVASDIDRNVPRSDYGGPNGNLLPEHGDSLDNNREFVSWGKKYTFYNSSPSDKSIGTLCGKYVPGSKYTDIEISIQYTTSLKNASGAHANAAEADPVGFLSNTVASDHFDNFGNGKSPNQRITSLPTPGLQFAKTNKPDDKSPLKPVPGAVFRLTKLGTTDQFLCDDGQFHTDDEIKQGRAHAIQARSNDKGIVTFVGVPIFNGETVAGQNDPRMKLSIVEYKAPKYPNPNFNSSQPEDPVRNPRELEYFKPNDVFSTVDFTKYSNKTRAELEYDTNGIGADINGLDFKDYEYKDMSTANPPFQDRKGKRIEKGMMNLRQDQNKAYVGSLPLTGGRGIVLMLIVGVALMIVGSFYKHRRDIMDKTRQSETVAE